MDFIKSLFSLDRFIEFITGFPGNVVPDGYLEHVLGIFCVFIVGMIIVNIIKKKRESIKKGACNMRYKGQDVKTIVDDNGEKQQTVFLEEDMKNSHGDVIFKANTAYPVHEGAISNEDNMTVYVNELWVNYRTEMTK